MKQIFIASDHRGFELKKHLKSHLQQNGHNVVDVGNKIQDPDDDYSDFAHALAKSVSESEEDLGISICGSGVGMSMTANKHLGIRSAVAHSVDEVKKACEHNHINIISLSADNTSVEDAKTLVDTFISAPRSSDARHIRRIEKVDLA